MGRHEGGCLCGAVRFAFDDEGAETNYCYCRSCRMATGGPLAAFVDLKPGAFAWTAGEPQFYVSSPGVRRGFCRTCGTAMTCEADALPGEVHVMSPTVDDPSPFAPSGEIFSEERIPWLHAKLTTREE